MVTIESLKFMHKINLIRDCPEIIHGSITRHGGFNACDPACLSRLQQELKIPALVQCNQCHGNEVYLVENIPIDPPACDALITQKRNIGLLIKHADCQAALFYDPINKTIGAAHSGWRGAVAKIYTKTIEAMQRHFGTKPEDLLVGISPFLRHAEFVNYKLEFPEEFWAYQTKPNYFDFGAIALNELNSAGVLSKHVNISTQCTYAEPESFYSHRREKSLERHGTIIALK